MNIRPKNAAALAVAILLAIAARSQAADPPAPGARLFGTWRGSSLAIVPADLREKLAGLPEDQLPTMTITYQRDGGFSSTLDAMGKSSSNDGSWEVVSDKGDDLEIRISGPQKKNARTATIKFLDNDTIEVENSAQSGKLKLERFRSVLDAPAAGAAGKPQPPLKRRTDKSDQFSYLLPPGWQVRNLEASPHDLLVLPSADGANRNIRIGDEKWQATLEQVKEKYDQDLPKMLKDFKPIASAIIELPDKRKALKLIHTNSSPGVPVRQINYITTVGDNRYQVTATALEGDGDKLDKLVEEFSASMAPVAAEKR